MCPHTDAGGWRLVQQYSLWLANDRTTRNVEFRVQVRDWGPNNPLKQDFGVWNTESIQRMLGNYSGNYGTIPIVGSPEREFQALGSPSCMKKPLDLTPFKRSLWRCWSLGH